MIPNGYPVRRVPSMVPVDPYGGGYAQGYQPPPGYYPPESPMAGGNTPYTPSDHNIRVYSPTPSTSSAFSFNEAPYAGGGGGGGGSVHSAQSFHSQPMHYPPPEASHNQRMSPLPGGGMDGYQQPQPMPGQRLRSPYGSASELRHTGSNDNWDTHSVHSHRSVESEQYSPSGPAYPSNYPPEAYSPYHQPAYPQGYQQQGYGGQSVYQQPQASPQYLQPPPPQPMIMQPNYAPQQVAYAPPQQYSPQGYQQGYQQQQQQSPPLTPAYQQSPPAAVHHAYPPSAVDNHAPMKRRSHTSPYGSMNAMQAADGRPPLNRRTQSLNGNPSPRKPPPVEIDADFEEALKRSLDDDAARRRRPEPVESQALEAANDAALRQALEESCFVQTPRVLEADDEALRRALIESAQEAAKSKPTSTDAIELANEEALRKALELSMAECSIGSSRRPLSPVPDQPPPVHSIPPPRSQNGRHMVPCRLPSDPHIDQVR